MTVQPELFEPTQPRRLIVPHGSEAWWGVDVSVRAVSVGAVFRPHTLPGSPEKPLQRPVVTVAWPKQDEAQRLATAHYELTVELKLHVQYGRLPRPGFVYVEQPSGEKPNLQLAYMVGTVLAAVAGAFPEARVETIPPQSWKKRGCGSGAIRKRDPGTGKPWRDPFGYPVLAMARDQWEYRGVSWDEADSLGIAEAARRTVLLEPR